MKQSGARAARRRAARADGDDDKENASPGTPRKAKEDEAQHSDHNDESAAALSALPPAGPRLGDALRSGPARRLPLRRRRLRAGPRGVQAPSAPSMTTTTGDGVPGGGEGPCVAGPPGGVRGGGARRAASGRWCSTPRRSAGVRKTFEDCARVRRLLEGLRVAFLERDVSMHAPYREELRVLLLARRSCIPRRLPRAAAAVRVRAVPRRRRRGGGSERARTAPTRAPACDAARRREVPAPSAAALGLWCAAGVAAVIGSMTPAATPSMLLAACRARRANENGLVPCPLCS
ncbi:hypothetical protein HU200_045083 [Digitaria exilis]|uniref:Glutaredoxin domain-containing protein n=1 Tax=Digitaria exilis TaxID=1010633 RepID=A0A835B1P6_9POAL|nr:hypothetical protein HU200_045083 [Digitaria exilis]